MQNTRISKLLEFFDKEPNDAFVIYALATEYNSLKDTEKALFFYQKLIKEHENYVGTYYHLAKLYETLGQKDEAIEIYKKGMLIARKNGNNHAFSELQGAYNVAAGLDYEDD
ncbi:MAG: tetratricopeptide repeat protein [Sphingobacteriaceae bacterium]|nr:tetratricopeptide repeat protein [Sphingobacteriaceae bacterium]